MLKVKVIFWLMCWYFFCMVNPYIFILCMECLSILIQKEHRTKRWKGNVRPVQLYYYHPQISLVLLTKKLLEKLLGTQSTVTLCSLLPTFVLNRFCGVSCQKIKLWEIQNFPSSKLACPQCKIFPCPSEHILNENKKLNGLQFWKPNTCPKTTGLTQKETWRLDIFAKKGLN